MQTATSTVLSTDERATLGALCNALLPALQPRGSDDSELFAADAVSRRVPAKVEETLAVLSEGDRSRFRLFLKMLDQPLFIAFQTGRAARFASLSVGDAERVLKSLSSSRVPDLRAAFQAVRRLATFHYYSGTTGIAVDPVWKAIGYDPSTNPPATQSPLRVTQLAAHARLECDACVIGSGAGGSVAAAVLAANGMKVIVLEAGSGWQSEDFDQHEAPGTRELYLDRGTTSTRDLSMALLAGAALGGGTAINWQTSFRTPQDVRDEWAKRSGISHFASDSFTRSLDAVCDRLSVGTGESQVNANNNVLRAGCAALNYDWSVIPRNSRGCDLSQCGYCVYGCRHGGKQSSAVTYLHDAQATGKTDVIAQCRADRIVIEHGKASGVVATATTQDGSQVSLRVSARIVVAACGSLHTPALLIRSGIRNAQIGRNLHVHPTTGVGGLFSNRIAAWDGAPQTIVCSEFAGLQNGYGFRLETAPAHPGLIALATPWAGARSHREAMQTAVRKALIIVLVRDRSTGVVSVDKKGNPVIDYRPGDAEQAMLREGMCRASRVLSAAGATGVQTLHTNSLSTGEAPEGTRRFENVDKLCDAINRSRVTDNHLALFSAHQMGTCRMGNNARSAVCDSRGEVFGVRGLFVADASAFPGSSGVNPMITIMALAHHNAGRISE